MSDETDVVVADPAKEMKDFMEQQNEINKKTNELLLQLLKKSQSEEKENEPPTKKKKMSTAADRDQQCSSGTKPRENPEDDGEISLHIDPDERLSDIEENAEGLKKVNPRENPEEEDQLWARAKGHQGKGAGEDPPREDSLIGDDDEELEDRLAKKYQELLDQTEEKIGKPIDQGLAFIIQKTWGRAVLNEEKKKELWKELDVPANCKVLKTPKLNTKIYIRVSENDQSKDRGQQAIQMNLTRAAIPVLTARGGGR